MNLNNINEIEAIEKAVALQNSRPLNLQFRLDASDLSAVLRTIYSQLSLQGHGKRAKSKRRHIRIVVTDLVRSYQEDPSQYLGLSLNANDYSLRSRYNKLDISYRKLEGAVRSLKSAGYIEVHIGYFDRISGQGACTRIRATETLVQLVGPKPKHVELACCPKEYEPIILRAGKPLDAEAKQEGSGRVIEYQDTYETVRMRRVTREYVEMIHEHVISNPADTRQWDRYPIIRRVFNNGRFDNGGRFYGGNWPSCKREIRQYILIDGEETVEIDYVALHACLEYARKGIGWWESVESSHKLLQDPYVMSGRLTENEWRLFYKKGLNIALSASSEITTIRALNQLFWIDKKAGKQSYPMEIGARGATKRELESFLGVRGRHAAITDLFYKGVGLELQYLDSQIAEEIYKTFTEKGKPVLGIHDSFLVKKLDAPFLEEVMFNAYKNKVGFCPKFK